MELPLARAASCSIICFLRVWGERPADIHRQISAVYGIIMSVQMVRQWVCKFDEGRTEVHDAPRVGRPTDTVNKNSVSAIRALIEEDCRITLDIIQRALAEEQFIEISRGSLHNTMKDVLDLSKLSMCWVSKNLSEDHRKARMGAALHFLTLYNEEGEALYDRIVTGDECWIYMYTPENKQQSKEWLPKGSHTPKKFKGERLTDKVFATIFWDTEGVLLIDFQPRRVLQNSGHTLDIWKLRRAIQNKRRGKLSNKCSTCMLMRVCGPQKSCVPSLLISNGRCFHTRRICQSSRHPTFICSWRCKNISPGNITKTMSAEGSDHRVFWKFSGQTLSTRTAKNGEAVYEMFRFRRAIMSKNKDFLSEYIRIFLVIFKCSYRQEKE